MQVLVLVLLANQRREAQCAPQVDAAELVVKVKTVACDYPGQGYVLLAGRRAA